MTSTEPKPGERQRRPLPPPLEPLPPDEALIAALSADTGIAAPLVRTWLAGASAPGHLREPLVESLWSVLGGINARVVVRRAENASAPNVARKPIDYLRERAVPAFPKTDGVPSLRVPLDVRGTRHGAADEGGQVVRAEGIDGHRASDGDRSRRLMAALELDDRGSSLAPRPPNSGDRRPA